MKIYMLVLLTMFMAFKSHAEIIVPALDGTVVDTVGALSPEEKDRLNSKIREVYQDSLGPQIVVLVVDTLQGYTVEEYAHKVFTTWKLGDAKRDDGVLLLLATGDRKTRIEVGQGLEGSLSDIQSKRILASPEFRNKLKEQKWGEGLSVGVSKISNIINAPEAVQMPANQTSKNTVSENSESFDFSLLFYAIGLVVVLSSVYAGPALVLASRKELKEAIEKSAQINASLKEVQVKYKNDSVNQIIEDLNKILSKNIKVKKELFNEFDKETLKQDQSPLGQLKALNKTLTESKSEVRELKTKLAYYQSLIKRGE